MTREEIDALWPEFTKYWRQNSQFYYCPEKQGLVWWWYQFIESRVMKYRGTVKGSLRGPKIKQTLSKKDRKVYAEMTDPGPWGD